jgi:hypothetical protein
MRSGGRQHEQLSGYLREAMWSEPAPIAPGEGWRRVYRSLVYSRVDEARRRRLRAWRSPEPWLAVQGALDRLAGGPDVRDALRVEGLRGSRYYPEGTLSIARGEFAPPFLFVAGYPRSGTTSLQNLVLHHFSKHLPEGSWNEPPYSMNLWWYPKHDSRTAVAIGALDPEVARVLLAVRPAVDAMASSAVYQGWFDDEWVQEQVEAWRSMLAVAAGQSVITITFEQLTSGSPHDVATAIASRAGVAIDEPAEDEEWGSLYARGVQDGLVGSAERSNMPDPRRRSRLTAAKQGISGSLGGTLLAELDAEYESVRALATGELPDVHR